MDKQDLDNYSKDKKTSFFGRVATALVGRTSIDDGFLDSLENTLIQCDVGVDTTLRIISLLETRAKKDKFFRVGDLYTFLEQEIITILTKPAAKASPSVFSTPLPAKPYVMLFVGVNGVGKTTTIGKISAHLTKNGKKVLLGAADTFRAAAIEQLKEWGNRSGALVVAQKLGSDPSSVAFDALQSALAQKADAVLIDTAGRLHNKTHLMGELHKVQGVLSKLLPDAPQETVLVIDATTGQNAFAQCRSFSEATNLSSLAITKLDGTAKGGVVIGLADQFNIPIKYIGTGEGLSDLHAFDPKEYLKSLLGNPR